MNGDYWMMFQNAFIQDGLKTTGSGLLREYAPVQFRVGSDGKVAAMGVTWLEVSVGAEDRVEGLVWFDKIV